MKQMHNLNCCSCDTLYEYPTALLFSLISTSKAALLHVCRLDVACRRVNGMFSNGMPEKLARGGDAGAISILCTTIFCFALVNSKYYSSMTCWLTLICHSLSSRTNTVKYLIPILSITGLTSA